MRRKFFRGVWRQKMQKIGSKARKGWKILPAQNTSYFRIFMVRANMGGTRVLCVVWPYRWYLWKALDLGDLLNTHNVVIRCVENILEWKNTLKNVETPFKYHMQKLSIVGTWLPTPPDLLPTPNLTKYDIYYPLHPIYYPLHFSFITHSTTHSITHSKWSG